MLKCIIFDFDGVIAESNEVKTQAFRDLFADYPQHQEAIAQYHMENGGISRFVKIRYFFEELANEELDDVKLKKYCDRYSELVKEKVVNAPYVPGIIEFLDKYIKQCKLYVISGTPEGEMQEIVKRRGLDKYFSGVFGSPKEKTGFVKEILDNDRYATNEVIFIGDSVTDFQAAKNNGIRFAARRSVDASDWLEDDYIEVVCNDLIELDEYFNQSEEVKAG